MKRILQHPAPDLTGKQYWRSVGELADTPEFRGWLEREFPAGAAEIEGDEVSRRSFLKLMGASMALAGFGLSSCRKPESHLVPFTKSAEWVIPGKFLYYTSAMPRRSGAMPLVVTTIDGRPIKVEGNPNHPESNGATDAFAQASVLDLYDPSRSQRFVRQGKLSDRANFEKYLTELRPKMAANGGAGVAFLLEETWSPTRDRLRAELEKQFPKMRWCVYDPLLSEAQHFSTEMSFGANSRVLPQFDKADVVFALDSDFLNCGEGDLSAVRGFTSRRRVREAKDSMNRLYVVENRFTLTGAMADHRLRFPASQIPGITHALALKIAAATSDPGLSSVLITLKKPEKAQKFDERWLDEAAADLLSKPGASLVVAGSQQPVVVQMMVYAMNVALKNVGTTLLVREMPKTGRNSSILQLASDIEAGRVQQLFIFGGDPVYNAPRAITQDRKTRQPLDWADLQKRVPDVVRLGQFEDATSGLSEWHVPAAHYLESWGDGLTIGGNYVAMQPMILPLFGGLSELDMLQLIGGVPAASGPELIQDTFRATNPPGDFATAWSRFLHDGVAAHITPTNRAAKFNGNTAGGIAHTLWNNPPTPTKDNPEIVLVGSYSVDDGRYINNGWLQEMPDPITRLTWDNTAMMSPSLAQHVGVKDGDLVEVTVTDTLKDKGGKLIQRQLVIAAMVMPGHADNSVTIPLGYGRKHTGPVGEDAGFNGYLLRTSSNPHFIVADGRGVKSVSVKKVGEKYALSLTQEHYSIEGRGLVREATLEHYREDENFVTKIAGDNELPEQLPTLYTHPKLDAPQQWGMTVDLNTCTGCSACVIACQAENNIPIVGKLQVSHGRAMHWIRIDRYYASAKPYNQDHGQWPENPEMVHEPMMCQHCENAPCETVCPVNATVHSESGLNVMVYNRCIGTRYCANNCPFKVRRFNFFDYTQRPVGKTKFAGFSVYQEYLGPLTKKGAADTVKLRANPNVTVRMRGVMEKCTYCIQRIEEAKISAHVRAGASPNTLISRDSFTSACAQACPAEAIVFGDIADPETRVSKVKAENRNYRLLEYLNVKTRTSYLARIRNPNPKMPDAKWIGVASPGRKRDEAIVCDSVIPSRAQRGRGTPSNCREVYARNLPANPAASLDFPRDDNLWRSALMDGAPTTAPQVLAGEASAAVTRPLARVPLVLNRRNLDWVTNRISGAVEGGTPRWWWVAFTITVIVAGIGFFCLGYLISTGVGTWGVNMPVAWAWGITNFVFWIGIGHAGTLISAILFLLRQKWRTSINRSAEAMTLFAVICAGIFPAVHIGRVWMAWFLAPVPMQYGIWPNFRSPLLWDVFAVSTYFSVSVLFWYTGLVPDLGTLRDRSTTKAKKFLYGIFALGWRGSNRNWRHYEMAYLLLAGLATPLVLSVHSVVSFDFATSVIPTWHTTIFPPYFVAGAIFGGFAMVLTLMIPARAIYKLQDIITPQHIDKMAKIILLTGSIVAYAYAMEFFIAWYSGNMFEKYSFYNRIFGPYWWYWWVGMLFCNMLSPQLFWFKWCRRNIYVVYFVCMCVNAGMWFERFIIIVGGLNRDFLPSSWRMFHPSWVDIWTFVGTFGIFLSLFLLFIRFLPMIAMSEVKIVLPEADPHHATPEEHHTVAAGGMERN